MIFIDNAIRLLAVALIAFRLLYWMYEEYSATQTRTAVTKLSIMSLFWRLFTSAFHVFLIFQLFGLRILPYQNALSNRLLGIFMIILATAISYIARKQMGANWSHAAEYQIREGQQLVTGGIYGYIRHPIYLGFVLTGLGVQFMMGSYLLLLFMIVLPWIAYWQSKREEKILIAKFGKTYEEYKKNTYMFLPYLL
ncbi:isoprenylcysteine carboxylmethyltransferase family protein [Candidatus Woesebacteria bacterium]|nr:isoprenylcysteine carboxylmethyltransferase family protein [Candidatus Woesebacteria bacterium]